MPTIPVLDSTMAYRSRGEGPPFVLIHGNPHILALVAKHPAADRKSGPRTCP